MQIKTNYFFYLLPACFLITYVHLATCKVWSCGELLCAIVQ